VRALAVLGLAALPLTWPVAATAAASSGQAPASGSAPVALTLPPPTGPDQVGTESLHLIDPNRRDPLVPSRPLRELMISLWYPATDTADYPTAPWMPPGAGAHFLTGLGIPADAVTRARSSSNRAMFRLAWLSRLRTVPTGTPQYAAISS